MRGEGWPLLILPAEELSAIARHGFRSLQLPQLAFEPRWRGEVQGPADTPHLRFFSDGQDPGGYGACDATRPAI